MKRLTKNHPTYKKFNQLVQFAEKLGLTITFRNSFGVYIQRDAPNGFPPMTECKIVRLEEGE